MKNYAVKAIEKDDTVKKPVVRVKKNPAAIISGNRFEMYRVAGDKIDSVYSDFGHALDAMDSVEENLKKSAPTFYVLDTKSGEKYYAFKFSKSPRVKKNPIVPGITARPVTGKRKPVFAVEYAKAKAGPWTTAGIFPNRTLADDYCKGMHDQNPAKWWRVVLK